MYQNGISHCNEVTLEQIADAMEAEASRLVQQYKDSFHPWSDASFSMKVGQGNPLKEVTA